MKTIIVSDIFGLTPHLELLASNVSSKYQIIDPYNGKNVAFRSEAEAYEKFINVCGIKQYTDMLFRKINSCNEKIFIVGFSVGASAVWNNLESSSSLIIQKAVCFYGSRIREKTEVKPCCDTVLIFPKKEDHFSVSELSRLLANTPSVRCINTDFHHGFMNRLSDNFDKTGYLKYLEWLKKDVCHTLTDSADGKKISG